MLTREQIAMRAAQEFRDGDHVSLGSGLPALCANYVPQGVQVTLRDSITSAAPGSGGGRNVAVLEALEVSKTGDLASPASGKVDPELLRAASRVIVAMEHTGQDGQPRIVADCKQPLTATGLVQRIITNLAVIDVTPEGLILREVAPGVSAAEVQAKTATPLLASHDLKAMELGVG